MRDDGKMDRREVLRGLAALPTLSALSGASGSPAAARPPLFNAIQMGPHTMLDEGLERCLDLIQETATINALMIYSHAYHGDLAKPAQMLAADHGVTPRDMKGRKLPAVWVKHNERAFKGTPLRHPHLDTTFEYAGRDLFAEVAEPARKRGMKLYARVLEGGGRRVAESVEGFSKIVARDLNGRPTSVGCWSHPDYRNWWIATVEDLFRGYRLDGLQWGAERQGPLMNTVFLPRTNAVPFCFCEHCNARGRAKGVDPERAREGYRQFYEYVRALAAGGPRPADGAFTGFLRILLRYPEILAWEQQFRLSREELMADMFRAVKAINPAAEVGWHLNHQPSSWDLVHRAQLSFAEMAPYSDFIKFIAYHDILGPRIRRWYLDPLQKTILGDISLEQSLDLYYDMFGYDKKREPKLDQLDKTGFSPDYVYRETRRSVASAEGKTKVYPGIGFDVPWGSEPFRGDPQNVYQSVLKAFEAGASGIVVSREYEEMRVPNLKAVGRAIRELNKA